MNAIETGLYNALAGDTALIAELGSTAIYSRHAPQGAALPFVVFNHAGGGKENLTPSDMQNHVYLVKAVASQAQGAKKAGTLAGLVLSALHNTTLTVSGYTNFYTAAEEEVQLTETARDGTMIYHTGNYYRIRIDD